MSRIAYTLKSSRWIPHALTRKLKQIGFDLCLELFPKLPARADDNWLHFAKGNKSWFCYEYIRDRIWTARDENMPEVENRTIPSTKTVLTVLWNLHRFHVVTTLPPGELFNAPWFIDQNLVRLV
jgi:hypothetical protein